jgi:hypothetical protein
LYTLGSGGSAARLILIKYLPGFAATLAALFTSRQSPFSEQGNIAGKPFHPLVTINPGSARQTG